MADFQRELRGYLKGLGIRPRRMHYYEQAFCHRSYAHEQKLPPHESNERLEFLGDSVLGLALTEQLLKRYPTSEEGDLSKMKAQLGSRQTLAEGAKRLGLADFLRLGRGEELAGSHNLPSLGSNTFEALVGALYLDHGFTESAKFVIKVLEPEFGKDLVAMDFKSILQEYAQRRFHNSPYYQVLRTFGPEHRKTFEVVVKLNGRNQGRGRGKTKKDAEQDAARHTLRRFGYQQAPGPQQVSEEPLQVSKRRWFWPFSRRKERSA